MLSQWLHSSQVLSEDILQIGSRKAKFRKWLENAEPKRVLLQQYVREFTRCLLFNYLGGKHTCCSLGQQCSVSKEEFNPSRIRGDIRDKPGIDNDERWERIREHYSYCVDGIPIP